MNPLKVGLVVCLTFPFIIAGVVLTTIFVGCIIGAALVERFIDWAQD